jgi:hypothetical protein
MSFKLLKLVMWKQESQQMHWMLMNCHNYVQMTAHITLYVVTFLVVDSKHSLIDSAQGRIIHWAMWAAA